MTDAVTILAERLQRIGENPAQPDVDWDAVAREALAFVAERLPTEEELMTLLPKTPVYVVSHSQWEMLPDEITARRLLRDLRERLEVKP